MRTRRPATAEYGGVADFDGPIGEWTAPAQHPAAAPRQTARQWRRAKRPVEKLIGETYYDADQNVIEVRTYHVPIDACVTIPQQDPPEGSAFVSWSVTVP